MQKPSLNDWLMRGFVLVCTGLLSLVTYIAKDIKEDVKLLTQTYPAIQQQIKSLEERTNKLEGKVFAQILSPDPAKHEPIITLQSLLKTYTLK